MPNLYKDVEYVFVCLFAFGFSLFPSPVFFQVSKAW